MLDMATFAGHEYDRGRNMIIEGVEGDLTMLATHIEIMLGKNDWGVELWRERVLQPDGKLVVLDSVEDYFLKPPRDGLGLPDMYGLIQMLESIGDKGFEALKLLPKRNYAATRAAAKGAIGPANSGKVSDNITHSGRGTSAEYTIRRLLKENRQDLVSLIEAGDISVNAAAIQAGFRKKTITVELSQAALIKALDKHFPDWRQA